MSFSTFFSTAVIIASASEGPGPGRLRLPAPLAVTETVPVKPACREVEAALQVGSLLVGWWPVTDTTTRNASDKVHSGCRALVLYSLPSVLEI
jgi:hypothetical protein